jgi:hypothetical protein
VACSSAVRYSTVHAGADSDTNGAQIYSGEDRLELARQLAPPSAVIRSEKDSVFEVDSTDGGGEKHEGGAALSAALFVRTPSGERRALIAVTESKGTDLVNDLRAALVDAGARPGFDVTAAYLDDDDSTKDAGMSLLEAVAHPTTASASTLSRAVAVWWSLLVADADSEPSKRWYSERAMSAAYGIALVEQLTGSDGVDLFAAIAVLRAPTDALALDILRLVDSAPRAVVRGDAIARPWRSAPPSCDATAPKDNDNPREIAQSLVSSVKANQPRFIAATLRMAKNSLTAARGPAASARFDRAATRLDSLCPKPKAPSK